MTSVVLVDTGGTVVEYVTAEEDPQQEGDCEAEMELEGEVEGECEAEAADEEVEDVEEADDYPAVIVEEVPGALLAEEQGFSGQVVVYEDEAYLMQEVGDEQEVETERAENMFLIQVFLFITIIPEHAAATNQQSETIVIEEDNSCIMFPNVEMSLDC